MDERASSEAANTGSASVRPPAASLVFFPVFDVCGGEFSFGGALRV
jgi:hypothetical protein